MRSSDPNVGTSASASALLARITEATWRNDSDGLVCVRDEVLARLGGDALVDAVAASANFHMMTRIADGTGNPLDQGTIEPTESIRETIGINDYVSRRHTPPRA